MGLKEVFLKEAGEPKSAAALKRIDEAVEKAIELNSQLSDAVGAIEVAYDELDSFDKTLDLDTLHDLQDEMQEAYASVNKLESSLLGVKEYAAELQKKPTPSDDPDDEEFERSYQASQAAQTGGKLFK